MSPDDPSSRTATQAIDQALLHAFARQQAGELQEAEKLYRAILQIDPSHPKANHNLGVVFVEMKRPAEGLPYFVAALEADPSHGQYWLSYVHALFQDGQLEAAQQILTMARQQGLEGEEVDALASCLKRDAQGTERANSEAQQLLKDSPPVVSAARQSSKKQTKPNVGKHDKSVTKSAAQPKDKPSPREIDSLIAVYDQGRVAEAASLAQAMTARFPRHWVGWKMLGVAFSQMERNAEALFPMQQTVALLPNDAEAHNNLGITLHDLGRLDEAEKSYRRAIGINPNYAEAHGNLAATLLDLGRPHDAEISYRRSLKIKPNNADAYVNLGNIVKGCGRLEEAETNYRRALQIKPDYAEAYCNLANTLRMFGKLGEAEANYRRALQVKPNLAEVHSYLGGTLHDLGRLTEAEASYRRALEIQENCASVHDNLGITLNELGRLTEAEACYRRALAIDPLLAEAHNNLGNTLFILGRLDEATVHFKRALEIKPTFAVAHSNLLHCLTQDATLDAETLFSEHRRFGEQFEEPLRTNWVAHTNSTDPDRRLQIGFVSGDFRNHVVASFIEPVLAHLSGYSRLCVHAYSNQSVGDDFTERLQGHCTYWNYIAGISDDRVAEMIRRDGIDILIDLSGHTGNNRLLTFARKPAPIQASWMGYPGTTGLRAMDYFFSDQFYLPRGQFDSQFTERIAYLPASAPFLPNKSAPAVNGLPALSNGYPTFGSFNRLSKLSRAVVAVWSQLLRALPDSRMLLGGMPEDGEHGELIEWFAQEGITLERLDIHPRSGMPSYLGLHGQVDICLDTFPYNGATTTLHALWMGVPTITLAGNTAAGRSGATILGHVGLEAFVAHDTADFVQKGLSWAGKLTALSDIRAGLRQRIADSAVGQPDLVAASLERALRIMWRRWCAGLPAESFEVTRQELVDATQEAGI